VYGFGDAEAVAAGVPLHVFLEVQFEFLPRVLVIGREASRVCGFGDLGALDLLQGVDALALVVESVHQMHIDGWMCIFV